MRYAISFLLLALATGLAQAQTPARPSGPITITAKSGEWQDGVMIYSGDVLMQSKTLELRGARLELRQPGGNRAPYEITLTGEPATLMHASEVPAELPVEARASRIVYNVKTGEAKVTGAAKGRNAAGRPRAVLYPSKKTTP